MINLMKQFLNILVGLKKTKRADRDEEQKLWVAVYLANANQVDPGKEAISAVGQFRKFKKEQENAMF